MTLDICTICHKTDGQRAFSGCGHIKPEAAGCPYFDAENKPLIPDTPQTRYALAGMGYEVKDGKAVRKPQPATFPGAPLTGERLYELWTNIGNVQHGPHFASRPWPELEERGRQSWRLLAECLNEWAGVNDD